MLIVPHFGKPMPNLAPRVGGESHRRQHYNVLLRFPSSPSGVDDPLHESLGYRVPNNWQFEGSEITNHVGGYGQFHRNANVLYTT